MTIDINETIKVQDSFGCVEEKVWYLEVLQGNIVRVLTEEGPSDDFSYCIVLNNFFTKESYTLNHLFVGMCEDYDGENIYVGGSVLANRLISKMWKSGKINLKYWTEVVDGEIRF
ncbi:hypothetical protein ZPAH1_orf00018 [Aeromonas phage ZPAH1]|nr:hypothetical protein ZPAH1_orf00018 [Aeromonas phage ZPAH1]